MTVKWTINQVDCYPELDDKKDVVSNIHWTAEQFDGALRAHFNGVTTLKYNPDNSFTSYDELTKAKLLAWVRADLEGKVIYAPKEDDTQPDEEREVLGNEYINLLQFLDRALADQKKPQLTQKAVPAV